MLKTACIILSLGEGFKLIASLLSLVASIFGKYAPLLKMTLSESEIADLNEKYLLSTKSLAVMHNSGATICSILVLVIIWTGLMGNRKWAFWTILLVGILSHITWFYSDVLIGNKTLIVNIVFTIIFLVGIILAGIALQ